MDKDRVIELAERVERLKQRRIDLGLTLRDVEAITGGKISNAYLSQLENGKIASPSVSVACQLAATYALPVETMIDWLNGDEVVEPPVCPTCGRAWLRTAAALRAIAEGEGE